MTLDSTVQRTAREMLERECHRLTQDDPQAAVADLSATERVLVDLIELLQSHRNERPVDWRPIVHQRLCDLAFVDEGGDAISDPRYRVSADRQEELVVTILKRVESHPVETANI